MARGDPWVPQVRYPDLASIMANASTARANEARVEQMRINREQDLAKAEAEKDRQLQLMGARQEAIKGNVNPLAQISPKEAFQFTGEARAVEAHLEAQENRREQTFERIRKRRVAKEKATLEEMSTALAEIRAAPPERQLQTYMDVRARLFRMAKDGVIDADPRKMPHPKQDPLAVQEKFMNDEWLSDTEKLYNDSLAMHADDEKFVGLQNAAAREMGYIHTGQAMVEKPQEFNKTFEKLAKLQKSEVSLKVGFEREKATKPVQSKLQTKLSEEQDLMSQVDLLMEMYDPKFTTWTGKGEQWLKRTIEASSQVGQRALSAEDKQSLEKYTQWKQQAEQIFSAYRKQITGAQAAMQEISYLRENMINKDLSDSEFRGAIKLLKEKMARGMRLKRRLLREGFDISELGPNATDEERKQFAEAQRRADGMWTSGDDFNSREDRQATLQELKIQGIPPDKALDMLKQWGYVK